MVTICPTVTAESEHQYREQIERVAEFTTHIHIDFMDGTLTSTASPPISKAWWPHTMQADLHLMLSNPFVHQDAIVPLNPRLVIVHPEADGDLIAFADRMHQACIKVGLALSPETPLDAIRRYISVLDHVLIFSGNLGHFGGTADLDLLQRIDEIRQLKPDLEIGWDGGINADNARQLAAGGIDILNVGGFMQRAKDPLATYQALQLAVGPADEVSR